MALLRLPIKLDHRAVFGASRLRRARRGRKAVRWYLQRRSRAPLPSSTMLSRLVFYNAILICATSVCQRGDSRFVGYRSPVYGKVWAARQASHIQPGLGRTAVCARVRTGRPTQRALPGFHECRGSCPQFTTFTHMPRHVEDFIRSEADGAMRSCDDRFSDVAVLHSRVVAQCRTQFVAEIRDLGWQR